MAILLHHPNIMTNDFIFFRKGFRANKFGIPAGVFSSYPIPTSVEVFYKKDVSKQLALGYKLVKILGRHINEAIGPSFSSYLISPGSSDTDLSNDILTQFSQLEHKLILLIII